LGAIDVSVADVGVAIVVAVIAVLRYQRDHFDFQ
jgi:hypothetical protein